MSRALSIVLPRYIHRGTVTFTFADGSTITCGDGTGDPVHVRFTTAAAERRILLDPDLATGEAWMDGTMLMERGTITDLLAILFDQPEMAPNWGVLLRGLRYAIRRISQFNPRARARANVAHHYDLDSRLYDLFLDADRQYSCAYYESPLASLDEAQLAKKRHLAAKLLLEPGQHILDIGSGWGGLGLYLAQVAGTNVTGITLSKEQLAIANTRAAAAKLSHRARFLFQDYRDVPGRYQRIVSVGMFEHVGVDHYDRFFKRCAELMTDDGVMLLHSIGRSEGPSATSPWVTKYIFPGGYIPALSEVLPAIERAGLLVCDIEILRLHYAETIKAWRERFLARRAEAAELYDERFVRMWEFYLAASEMSFRKQNMMNFQIQLTRRQGIVPMTRDYIARAEERLRAAENSGPPRLQIVS